MSTSDGALIPYDRLVLATGSHYKTATLTETNSDGQPIAIWVLGTVFVSNDTVTKNKAGLPVEKLTFVFGSTAITFAPLGV